MRDWEDAMSDQDRMDEAAITRVLERQPEVRIPVDFAAKVRAALPAQSKVRVRRSVGRGVAAVAAVGLVLALCWLAPHARPSFESMAFDLEMVLVVELMGVAAWLGTRRSDG
jgi:ferric-dicitrate binding protein FerR (iron transport regulator)